MVQCECLIAKWRVPLSMAGNDKPVFCKNSRVGRLGPSNYRTGQYCREMLQIHCQDWPFDILRCKPRHGSRAGKQINYALGLRCLREKQFAEAILKHLP